MAPEEFEPEENETESTGAISDPLAEPPGSRAERQRTRTKEQRQMMIAVRPLLIKWKTERPLQMNSWKEEKKANRRKTQNCGALANLVHPFFPLIPRLTKRSYVNSS